MGNSKSQCGKEWGLVNFKRGPDVVRSIASNGSRYVAVGDGGLLMTSEDGMNWTRRPRNYTNQFCVIYNEEGSQFVVVGDRQYIATSTNGIKWVRRKFVKGSPALWGVAYGNGVYVATGEFGTVFTSLNGADWTERKTGINARLTSVVYGKGLFAAVGPRGFYSSSNKGVSWRTHGSAASGLISVTFGNNTFVAGGRDGVLYTSKDGKNWTKRETGLPNFFWDLTYVSLSGLFVGVGNRGNKSTCMIVTSPDGVNWTWRESHVTTELLGVGVSSDKVIAGGLYGAITVSLSSVPRGGKLVVVSPRGGELWDPNSSQEIRWGSFGSVGKVKLEYSTDNGSSWTVITPSTANNGIHAWKIPQEPSNQCLVRVSEAADGKPSAASNATFRITGAPPGASLTVTSPKGGEQLAIGSKYTIKWTSQRVTDPIRIRCSWDGGENYSIIARKTPNTGTYTWKVPNMPSTNCLIRISGINTDGLPVGISDNTFIIGDANPTITLTSPKGGESWDAGSTHNITWISFSVGEFVKLELSIDGGSSWKDIDARTRNDGTWDWTVPNIPSSNCFIRVSDYSNPSVNGTNSSAFTLGEVTSIILTSPIGGSVWEAGSTHDITWTSSGVGEFVKLELSIDGGSSWKDIDTRTRNDGTWEWTVPDTSSSNCYIRVSDYSNPSLNDTNNRAFTIGEVASITLTSPNGGENWMGDSTQTITWTTSGTVDNVMIEYSIDNSSTWDTITALTQNDGTFLWTVPNISSDKCMVKISDASYPRISGTSGSVFSISEPPEIALSKTGFEFSYITGGAVPTGQTFYISNKGVSTLKWTAAARVSWIKVSPASGTGDGTVTISVDPSGLGTGEHNGIVMVSDPDASNSPQIVDVYLSVTVKEEKQDLPPLGKFATPQDGAKGVNGSIAVTGWALDAKGVDSVKIYREVDEKRLYIGDANFVEGARPDVEKAYPNYPNNSRAGWGYTLLTNFLPDGELVLKAIAKSTSGEEFLLGTKTIYLDNQNAVKPFGAVDAPAQGGDASGTNYRCRGWSLTPPPNKIPEDGSTINVFIDGKFVGKATYNIPRADITKLFPDCANSKGAAA
ncbi:MAG: hypothetical protein GTO45_04600, partial [Candidatus Aminicenantes bacterium]|nr:hypothetical protein [Candidatus Aminicenantes bacterium]NIM78031.1 hypothetical protein [Candidatus Aminicenantes bacterium]NIN17351.1 hypothetical protein [Candidatus Aminicenantes bacterium]NIN41244.1 hypothetical protein [Candidatus Aminicenantes bacterium]NIN84017.1 hypothetical protein [Candidatus Aminicenantes bacterium]